MSRPPSVPYVGITAGRPRGKTGPKRQRERAVLDPLRSPTGKPSRLRPQRGYRIRSHPSGPDGTLRTGPRGTESRKFGRDWQPLDSNPMWIIHMVAGGGSQAAGVRFRRDSRIGRGSAQPVAGYRSGARARRGASTVGVDNTLTEALASETLEGSKDGNSGSSAARSHYRQGRG